MDYPQHGQTARSDTAMALPEALGLPTDGTLSRLAIPIDLELTPQQVLVVKLLLYGLPNKAIAERLRLSESTVKAHVTGILRKTGAGNRTQAVLLLVRRMLDLGELP